MDRILELIEEVKNLTLQIRQESLQFREEAKEDNRRQDKILARLESNEIVLAQILERMEQRTSDHERRISDLENY